MAGPLWASVSQHTECLLENAVSGPLQHPLEGGVHCCRYLGKLRPGVPQRLNDCRQSQKRRLPAVLFGVPMAAPAFNEKSALGPLGHWLLRDRSWVGSHGGDRRGRGVWAGEPC